MNEIPSMSRKWTRQMGLVASLALSSIFSVSGQNSKFVRFAPLEISVLVEYRNGANEFVWKDLGILNWSNEQCTGCVHYESVMSSASVRLTIYDTFSVLTVNSIDGEFEIRLKEQPVSGINKFIKVYRAASEIWGRQSYTEEEDLIYRSLILSSGW